MHPSSYSRAKPTGLCLALALALIAPQRAAAAAAPQFDLFSAHQGSTFAYALLMQPGIGFQAGVTLQCFDGGKPASEDIPNATVGRSGRFSYSGSADYTRAGKLTHVQVKLQGAVLFRGALTLGSASAIAIQTDSKRGCGAYVGTLPPHTGS